MEKIIESTLHGAKKGAKGGVYATGAYTLLAGIGTTGAALASGESVAAMIGLSIGAGLTAAVPLIAAGATVGGAVGLGYGVYSFFCTNNSASQTKQVTEPEKKLEMK